MDADKQRLWHGGAANKHSSYHISFILCAAPSPPLALVLFGTSFMHICGCHRDLVLSVTARSTLIIHFRIFGILFFSPSLCLARYFCSARDLKRQFGTQNYCVLNSDPGGDLIVCDVDTKCGNGNQFDHLIHPVLGITLLKANCLRLVYFTVSEFVM